MRSNQLIPYAQMERFLKTCGDPRPGRALSDALQRYLKNEPAEKPLPPMPKDVDIITVSDADFIKLCDRILVNPAMFDEDPHITSAAMFPYNYGCFIDRHLNSLRVSEMHDHDFFELCYVWEGRCLQYTSGQSFPMTAGDFLLIPPGVSHRVEVTGSDTVLFNILVRTESFLSESFALLAQNNVISTFLRHCLLRGEGGHGGCLLIHTDNGPLLKRIVKHLTHECHTNQELFCDFAINVFNQLFCYLLANGVVRTAGLSLPEDFSFIAIFHEIQQNYKTITLKSLADKYFFSEEHLSRLIRKATGKTFSVLRRETRINQAKLLIARTKLSIESISELVGYSDASSLTKAFKHSVGQSPLQYRKRHTN